MDQTSCATLDRCRSMTDTTLDPPALRRALDRRPTVRGALRLARLARSASRRSPTSSRRAAVGDARRRGRHVASHVARSAALDTLDPAARGARFACRHVERDGRRLPRRARRAARPRRPGARPAPVEAAGARCASRHATCSASPTCATVGARARRSSAQACLERRARARRHRRIRSRSIGMGKLGGRELNYASDVDVLFVHDGDERRGRARGPRGARDDDRPERRRHRVPHRRRPAARRPRRARSAARSTATRRTGNGGRGRGSSRR